MNKKTFATLALGGAAIAAVSAIVSVRYARADGVPAAVPVQGCVRDSQGQPLDGNYTVTFRLYADQNAPIGQEFYSSGAVLVEFHECVFSQVLSPNLDEFSKTKSAYLGIAIGADNELNQRFTIGTTPYAAQALHADRAASAVTAETATAATTAGNGAPPGSVMAFAGTTLPDGWLWCDGKPVSRGTYAALFAAIGTSHGFGDNASTFNVPDYRGRFLRGVDNGSARDPDRTSRTAMATGGNVGETVGSVQSDAFASHAHTQSWQYYQWGDTNSSGVSRNNGNPAPVFPGATTNPAGGNETRPLNAAVHFIIKY